MRAVRSAGSIRAAGSGAVAASGGTDDGLEDSHRLSSRVLPHWSRGRPRRQSKPSSEVDRDATRPSKPSPRQESRRSGERRRGRYRRPAALKHVASRDGSTSDTTDTLPWQLLVENAKRKRQVHRVTLPERHPPDRPGAERQTLAHPGSSAALRTGKQDRGRGRLEPPGAGADRARTNSPRHI